MQTLVALGNTIANSFALVYLVRQGHEYLDCALFIFTIVIVSLALMSFASRAVVSRFPQSIETGMIFLVLYYIGLMFLDGWYLVFIPPIMFGIYMVTFWVPYNALIMHISSSKARGATVGAYFLIWPMVTTIGPLLGGLIIDLQSYRILFLTAAVVITANLVYIAGWRVLSHIRQRTIIPELLQSLWTNIVQRRRLDVDFAGVGKRLIGGLFAQGVADGVLWIGIPLITFEFAENEVTLSGYLSLFAFWGAVMTVALGYLSDRIKNRTAFVRVCAAFSGISLIVAAIASSAEGYGTAMSMANFWIAVVPAFLFTMLLDQLERFKKKGVIVREFLLNAGRAIGATIIILSLIAEIDLELTLMVAGAAYLAIVLVK